MSLRTMTRAALVWAAFACGLSAAHAQTFTLDVAAVGDGVGTITGNGITCPPDCGESFPSGTTIVLTATGDQTTTPPSSFGGVAPGVWTGCDSTSFNQCTVTLTANRTVTAKFGRSYGWTVPLEGWQQAPYVITGATGQATFSHHTGTGELMHFMQVSGVAGAVTSVQLHSAAPRGSTAPILFALTYPNYNVIFLTPEQSALLVSGQWYITVRTTGYPDGELRGQIDNLGAATRHDLAISRSGSGTGTVTATTEAGTVATCGATCSASIPQGKVATLAAAPANGSTFTGWSGACSGTGPCDVPMDAARAVTASFRAGDPPRMSNISTRGGVLTGENVIIGGFIIGGSANKTVVVRARGPSLAAQGVPGTLADPQLQLFSGATQIAFNNNWQDAADAGQLLASGFAPADATEAALLVALAPGAYTAIVTGAGNTTGIGIVEIFEVDAIQAPFLNISTRGLVQTGDNVLIGGFIVQGAGPQTVVVRARGPSLASQGVAGVLGNPVLQLFSGATQIASNDNWQAAANAADVQASGFAPSESLEAAILITLQPGAYTAVVSGSGGSTGVGIVEVFGQ